MKKIDFTGTLVWLLFMALVMLSGCDVALNDINDLVEWLEENGNGGPGEVQADTIVDPATCDTLNPAIGPDFISGALEWDNPIDPDSILWHYEDYTDNSLAEVIKYAALDMGVTIDTLRVWETVNGVAYILDGTSAHTPWLIKIWTNANSNSGGVVSHGWPEVLISSREAKWWLPATSKGFYFGSILIFDQYKAVAVGHANVERFNFRGLVATLEQFMELAGIILGDCILGRDRADFRWGTFEPFIFDYFESADWEEVITP